MEKSNIAGISEGFDNLLTIASTGMMRGRVAYGTLSVELGDVLDAEIFQLDSTDDKLIPIIVKGLMAKSRGCVRVRIQMVNVVMPYSISPLSFEDEHNELKIRLIE